MVEIIDTSLLIEPDKKWFNHKLIAEPDKKLGSSEPQISQEKLTALKDEAKKLLDQDIFQYNQWRERTKKSETNWMRTVLNKGTLGDKISVSSVLIQESAVHNLNSLQSLIGSVKLSKKRECILAMDALKGLFSNYLLPSDRPLATFQQHSFRYLNTIKEKRTRDKCLVLWYFEANLKEHYNSFIRALQGALQDNLAATKFKVCSVLFELIASNQFEQERYILEVAINKLGDPDHQVASRILFYIKNFLFKCPKMKMAVLNEVERLVTRPNINSKAQYYGFCCLNQFVLAKQDQLVANKLLVVYFAFFKKFVRNKEIDSRMLSALLTGVNRAYKFAKMDSNEIDENLNTIFKLVHITSFNVSLQALMLLNQVAASREDMQNRYFSALYRKMLDLESKSTAKETFFLNLLYNSLIKDEAITRVKAFVKRLFQICFSQNAPFVCGSFILISEFLKAKKNLFHLDYSVLNENGVQVQKRAAIEDDNEDEEEHFEDVKGDSDSEKEDESEKKENKNGNKNIKKKDNRKAAGSSWQHQKNVIFKRHDRYDYHERNPLYAGADKTLTYELLPFTRHFHPTVVVFANRLLNNEPVDYTGDPMEDFTLIHFLDRFVYKNPKKVKEGENQPKKSVFEPVKSIHKSNTKNLPVNSKEYLNLDPNQIPEEEKFFYNYYKAQAEKKSKLDEELDSEAESISDSEFDAYLNNTEVDGIDGKDDDLDLDFADAAKKDKKKKKKKDAESESDSDDDLLDLDDEFESDDEFEKAMNEEGGEEEEEAEEEEEELPKKKSSKKSKEKDFSSLFAAADEFSELINESSKYDEMGVGGISNADNANPRQLRWEMDRDDDFARGGNKRRNKSKKPNPVKKRMGGNKVKVNRPKKLKKK